MRQNLALLAGLAVVVLWASAFPAIRVASPVMGPVGLSFARLGVATVALIVMAAFARVRMPRGRDLGGSSPAGSSG